MSKFQDLKNEAINLGIDAEKVKAMKSTKEVEAAIAEVQTPTPAATAPVVVPGKKPGRPINPNSVRQARVTALAVKAANGELKRGRPVDPTSERAIRMAERAAKEAQGIELKRGRPAFTPEQKAEAAAKKAAEKAAALTNIVVNASAPVDATVTEDVTV